MPRVLIVHLLDGCGNRWARAWSADPYAVSCLSCLHTRQYRRSMKQQFDLALST